MSYWKCCAPSCKNLGHYKVGVFINNYFSIGILGILYLRIWFKSGFDQAHCVEGLKSNHTKFIS
jgi:hypothetical protein